MRSWHVLLFFIFNFSAVGWAQSPTAKEILSNPKRYPAISFGGYRALSRDTQPSVAELKEDLRLLYALNIRLLRTYNTRYAEASRLLQAIRELKKEQQGFEMYVMLGAWIQCKNAFTSNPDHKIEDFAGNEAEVNRAVKLCFQYPDIVKIIAVGNESMVHWAATYFVKPGVVLKYVNKLQAMKKRRQLPANLWITSSDNFASWGGGEKDYHLPELKQLIRAVDFISMHTYPMHDTHYNPAFWGILKEEIVLSDTAKIRLAMNRAVAYAQRQYRSVVQYMRSLGVEKPVHIGETGWATSCNGFYGVAGSQATDEYKQSLYYQAMRSWTESEGISCFFFEAFDEIWKDADNPGGSENHFGLFTVDGQAKYVLWKQVDEGGFGQLKRGGKFIHKTYQGNFDHLYRELKAPNKVIE